MTKMTEAQRGAILAWLRANDFRDHDGYGYYKRTYGLSHDYITLSVGIPAGQTVATLAIDAGNYYGRPILVGEASTVTQVAVLWAALTQFDYMTNLGLQGTV